MKSWKGRELGYNAPQPGDASTKLGAGGPTGKGRVPMTWKPSEMMDPVDIDKTEDYKLPVNDVQHDKEFKNFPGVSEQKFITMAQLTDKNNQTGYIEGVTEYWHDSLSGMKGKPGNG